MSYQQWPPQYGYPGWGPATGYQFSTAAQSGGVSPGVAQGPPQGPPQPFGQGVGETAGGQASGAQGQRTSQQVGAPVGVPAVDVVESPTELLVYVDTPGFEKEDVHVHADANTLVVSADRTDDPTVDPESGDQAIVVERPLRLERTIPLPVTIDPDQASAEYDDGVCVVHIPKGEQDRRREIGFQ